MLSLKCAVCDSKRLGFIKEQETSLLLKSYFIYLLYFIYLI